VLAHGLDRIYPPEHRTTALEMLTQGGLLTEYPSNTSPERYNFVTRNSIIAGLSDATIVVESAAKGGSLITAEVANAYNREVFAVPGRVTDNTFKGCLQLIKRNKAALLDSLKDLEESLGWSTEPKSNSKPIQQELPFDLTDEQQTILAMLNNEELHINQLAVRTNIAIHQLPFLLLELELKNLVKPLPGGIYKRN
jgi:DNA processing protein